MYLTALQASAVNYAELAVGGAGVPRLFHRMIGIWFPSGKVWRRANGNFAREISRN